MNYFVEKVIFSIIGLVLVFWIGYHILDYYESPLNLETAFEYNVSQRIVTEGIAIRDEEIIQTPVLGIENYLFEDAERVTVGQTVVEFYDSQVSDRNIKRMREIEAEISMLTSAQDKNSNNFSNAENINRDIRGQIGRLSAISSTGDLVQTAGIKAELVNLLNRRQIATGKAEDFFDRIAMLNAEYASLQSNTLSGSLQSAAAPRTGFFVKTVDGYEQYLSSKILKEYKINDYLRAIRSKPPQYETTYVGKIVTNHVWYFAASAKKYNIEYVKKGQQVYLDFTDKALTVSAIVSEVISENGEEDAVIIFECGQVSADISQLRKENVVVRFKDFRGLRINISSIRFASFFEARVKNEDINSVKKGQNAQIALFGTEIELSSVIVGIRKETQRVTVEKDGEKVEETQETGYSIVKFECRQISKEIEDLGTNDVIIYATDFTETKITGTGLGFEANLRGVYVIEESIIRFKRLNPIYEEQGFVISEMNVKNTPGYKQDYVGLFSRVTTKGVDLYDGKPIQ